MYRRLKTRREFLAAAKGHRTTRPAFLLQARERGDDGPPRFGFTVSKRTAKSAVERNRIRRRLKEVVRRIADGHARPGYDYVLVGRHRALSEPFSELEAALVQALNYTSGAAGRADGARKADG